MWNNLLLVDDDSNFLMTLAVVLKDLSTQIDTAVTLAEAKSFINGVSYEVIITDVRLTQDGEEGLEVLEYAKQKYPTSHVVVLTGQENPDMKRRAIDLGASQYFEKPVELKSLIETIRNLA